jgi:hypothetical protein
VTPRYCAWFPWLGCEVEKKGVEEVAAERGPRQAMTLCSERIELLLSSLVAWSAHRSTSLLGKLPEAVQLSGAFFMLHARRTPGGEHACQ